MSSVLSYKEKRQREVERDEFGVVLKREVESVNI